MFKLQYLIIATIRSAFLRFFRAEKGQSEPEAPFQKTLAQNLKTAVPFYSPQPPKGALACKKTARWELFSLSSIKKSCTK